MNLLKMPAIFVVGLLSSVAANAGPITFGFYQGGYDENAFVAGYFRAEDTNGSGGIHHGGDSATSCSVSSVEGLCEVTDYFMYFSGNSHVPSFSHSGLRVLDLVPSGDFDDFVGVVFDIGDDLIPEFDEDSGNYFGIIGSQDWRLEDGDDGGLFPGARWQSNPGGLCSLTLNDERPGAVCGSIDYTVGRNGERTFTGTAERVRLFTISDPNTVNVPEPSVLALLSIGMLGMSFAGRRRRY